MAATLTEEQVLDVAQGLALAIGTIKGDNSYPTGGWAIDAPGDLGYRKFVPAGGGGGYLGVWDKVNQKLIVYRQTAATSALVEVPNATDLSAVTFDFIGVRPK